MTNKTRRRLRITSISAAACALFGCKRRRPRAAGHAGESVYYTFEKFAPGSAPESFAMAPAGGAKGSAPVASEASSASPRGPWMIEALAKSASGRNALVQPETGAPGTPIVWIRNANYRDVKASVAARGRGAEGAPNAGSPGAWPALPIIGFSASTAAPAASASRL